MYAQLPLKIGLREEACFETFVAETESLTLALADVQKNLKKASGQAFCFVGPSGVGKTHLLQAACRYQIEIQQSKPSASASVYLPLGDQSLPLVPAVLDGMEQISLVCVDDVDGVIGQTEWELALANLLMKAKSQGHSIMLSSQSFIGDWPIKTKELASAMMSVLPIDLAPLDSDKEIVYALQKHADKLGFKLPVEVCNFLIKQFSKDLQELLAVVGLLEEASFVQKRRITLPFVKQVLSEKAL
ncbi:MAG: DnaA regulatory inactivator Hda [Hydrogenovibrio sp.]|nr:DnaA regulatory inactivator Hda [Hydrogenovibrio sp.]